MALNTASTSFVVQHPTEFHCTAFSTETYSRDQHSRRNAGVGSRSHLGCAGAKGRSAGGSDNVATSVTFYRISITMLLQHARLGRAKYYAEANLEVCQAVVQYIRNVIVCNNTLTLCSLRFLPFPW